MSSIIAPEPCLEQGLFTEPLGTLALAQMAATEKLLPPDGTPKYIVQSSRRSVDLYRLRSQMDQTNQSWAKKTSVIGQRRFPSPRRFSTLISIFAQDDPRTSKYFTLRICRQTWVDITAPSTIYPP